MIEVELSVAYDRNAERYSSKPGYSPCANCHRPVKEGPGTRWVHCADGGMWTYITEAEYERGEVGCSDMGCWPLGSDCYRRLRKLHGSDFDQYVTLQGEGED